jgi:hypothetical protein
MNRHGHNGETVLAAFPRPDSAKAAVATLERAGIAPRAITVVDEPHTSRRTDRDADAAMARAMSRSWKRGAVFGGLIGLILGALVAALVTSDPLVAGGTIVGGAVAGAFVGGFISAGLAQPRTSRAWDVYLRRHDEETCVCVVVTPAKVAAVEDVLRRAGASAIERMPDDGSDDRR